MKKISIILLTIHAFAFAQPKNGLWRGILLLHSKDKIELPFVFEIKNNKLQKQIIIHNGIEKIVVDEITLSKDSFNFKMPIFDSEFKTKLIGDTLLTGVWINHARKEHDQIVFNAQYGNSKRFNFKPTKSNSFYNGKWEVTFSPNKTDSTKAIGVFLNKKKTPYLTGTFLTETGDYRFLEGMEYNNKIYLSCFDGSHAFLFIAENSGEKIINGQFYSGSHWQENWIACRNNSFKLSDPEGLTKLASPDAKIDFSFLNLDKQKISISDIRYKNKPIVIQIMGSWCPNCMDESAYLADVYNRFNKNGLEIISICYERTNDFEKAKANILRLKKRYNLKHEFLIPGLTGKDNASKSLPFLNKVIAFPTTIILDKNHTVKSIYTGFSGPATGLEYMKYKENFEKIMEQITK